MYLTMYLLKIARKSMTHAPSVSCSSSLAARCQCAAGFNTAFVQLLGAPRAGIICEPTAAATFEQILVCMLFPTLASQYLLVPYKCSLHITDTPHETKAACYFLSWKWQKRFASVSLCEVCFIRRQSDFDRLVCFYSCLSLMVLIVYIYMEWDFKNILR